MTVAVSTSSALDQLASLVPAAGDYKVLIAAAVITLITIANLRGLRESGNIFAVPTYVFVVLALGHRRRSGVVNIVTGNVAPAPAPAERGARSGSSRSCCCCCSGRSRAARSR